MNADAIYQSLRDDIAGGLLHPNERLVEADLTETFHATRAAVRAALLRLEQERLIQHERNRGARVRLVPPEEAVEIYEIRSVLEGFAASRAADVASADDVTRLRSLLARIREQLDVEDLRGASGTNMDLHAAIVALAGHGTVERLIGTLNPHLVRHHYRTILQPERPEKSFAEHSAIVEAIARRDADGAERAMRDHLRSVTATLRKPLPERAL